MSFTSQQHRALNLIWALKKKDRARPGQSAAVIGGGIAGVTTAAALLGLGCRVHLYEKDKDILSYQRDAAHRFVHPTIARWPDEALEDTTKFPFFDWYAAPADVIIRVLLREWNYIADCVAETVKGQEDGIELLKVFPNTRVAGLIAQPETEYDGVGLKTVPPNRNPTYDFVVVTVGFGKERSVNSIDPRPYWDKDDLDKASWSQCWTVSGCGDGGLLDCLRLVYNDFRGGGLAVDIAKMWEGHASLSAIKEIEFEILWNTDDDVPARLAKIYRDALDDVPPDVLAKLKHHLTADTGKVTLISQEKAPFISNSAPIHKLMLAYALKQRVVVFRCAEIKWDPEKKKDSVFYDRKHPDDLSHLLPIVVRHGPVADLEGLLLEFEAKALFETQKNINDHIDRDDERDIALPPGYPKQPAVAKHDLAVEYLKAVAPSISTLGATEAGFVCDADPAQEIPARAFGIPVSRGLKPAAELL